MKKLFVFIAMLPFLASAQNDSKTTTLKINEIVVVDKSGNQYSGSDQTFDVRQNKNTSRKVLFENNEVKIEATYKIVGYNSRRSSTKTGAVKVTVNYISTYAGKKDKRTSEYVFYLDDARKFDVKENFVYKRGIKSYGLTLTYKGVFID